MTWYTYILLCADDSLYTGITNDLVQRVALHNQKKGAKYTLSRLPVNLIWYEMHHSKSKAQKREWQIKTLSRSEKLQLIEHFTLQQ